MKNYWNMGLVLTFFEVGMWEVFILQDPDGELITIKIIEYER